MSKKYPIIIGCICLVIIIILLYGAGYRVQGFHVGKTGTLTVAAPLSNTDIYVDTSRKITTPADDQLVSFQLMTGTHQIIVSKAGYLPWAKKVDIVSGTTTRLFPVLVTSNTTGEIITTRDPQYYAIASTIRSASLPTADAPLVSADTSARLWVADNSIYVKDAAGDTHVVIAPEPALKNVAFYKNRSDVVIFAAGDGVFVIETADDPGNIQNIFPIYKGADPRFIPHDNGSIYVFDSDSLMAVVI